MKMSFEEISKRNNVPDGRFYHPANIFLSRQLFILFISRSFHSRVRKFFSFLVRVIFLPSSVFFLFFFFTFSLYRHDQSRLHPCYSVSKVRIRFEEINYDMIQSEEGETTRIIFNRKDDSLDGSLNNFKLRRKLKWATRIWCKVLQTVVFLAPTICLIP